MNIADKLLNKIDLEKISIDEIKEELGVISSLINNVDTKLEMIKKVNETEYNDLKEIYLSGQKVDEKEMTRRLVRTTALETALDIVKINLIGDDENVER